MTCGRKSANGSKLALAPQPALSMLEAAQLALKILANATSYGIYLELNVEELADPITALLFDGEGRPSAHSARLRSSVQATTFYPLA